MKIKATTSFFCAEVSLSIGEIKDVDDVTAGRLIRTGLAKEVTEAKKETKTEAKPQKAEEPAKTTPAKAVKTAKKKVVKARETK